MNSTELKDCSLLWNGPKWLEEDSTLWPTWNTEKIDEEMTKQIQSEETEPRILYEATTITKPPDETHATPCGIVKERFSSLPKMLQVTAYVQRFIMKLRKIATPEGTISAEEMEGARMRWKK